MNLKKLSVKNFIGDLPRIINESLTAIENAFGNIYNEETNTIGNDDAKLKCKSIETNGISVYTGDIIVMIDGEPVSLIDIYDRVKALEYDADKSNLSKSLLAKKKLQ